MVAIITGVLIGFKHKRNRNRWNKMPHNDRMLVGIFTYCYSERRVLVCIVMKLNVL